METCGSMRETVEGGKGEGRATASREEGQGVCVCHECRLSFPPLPSPVLALIKREGKSDRDVRQE